MASSLSVAATSPPAPADDSRPTTAGMTMAATALLIAASAIRAARIEVGGLLVHPYLALVALLFPALLWMGLPRFPRSVLAALVAFGALWTVSAVQESGGTSEVVKVASAIVTMICTTCCVRSEGDYRWISLALAVAGAAIAFQGLLGMDADSVAGINPMEGVANKNAFSIYTLPGLLLAGHLTLDPKTARWMRYVAIATMLVTTVAMFSTGNRSGWLGTVLVAAMLLLRNGARIRGFIAVGLLTGAAMVLIQSYGDTRVFEHRVEQTEEGYKSDDLRLELFVAALDVGREYPLFGASPQRLPIELARRVPVQEELIDPHNVFGLMTGGAGFVTTIAFLILGWILWRRPPWFAERARETPGVRDAHYLLRAMLVLWIVRGTFSREILYSPTFAIGLGICIGLCVAREFFDPPALARKASPV